MKKIIYLFIPFLFFNCSVTKDKNAPINDYLSSLHLENKKIMIIEEKINNNVTIDIFRGQIYFEPLRKKYERNEGVQEPLYVKRKWERMKDKYEDIYISDYWIRDNYWTLNDFKNQNIVFIKRENFPNPGKYEEFDFKEYLNIFSFSEPIYYDKKYAVFTKIKTDTNDKTFADTSILIMEKKGSKWEIIKDVGDEIYN